eukprot:SAG11_NODE_1397_length_5032_cov_14.008109_5_plen_67_part_00
MRGSGRREVGGRGEGRTRAVLFALEVAQAGHAPPLLPAPLERPEAGLAAAARNTHPCPPHRRRRPF